MGVSGCGQQLPACRLSALSGAVAAPSMSRTAAATIPPVTRHDQAKRTETCSAVAELASAS